MSSHCCVSYSTSKERGPCLEDQLVSGVGLFPFQMAGPRCLINGGYYLLTKWDDPSKMVVRPSYLHMYICHDRSLRLLYMYLLIYYRSSKFVEKLHFCICVHNKYDLIGLSRNATQVFESSQISTFLLLCYLKNALLGKHPWCFKVGGPHDFLYLHISPAWTSHKSLRIFMQMWSPQIAESAKRFSRCTKATTPPKIHPELLVSLPVKHGNGKLPVLIGDASSNGSFSVVMLVFWGEGLRSKRSPLKPIGSNSWILDSPMNFPIEIQIPDV